MEFTFLLFKLYISKDQGRVFLALETGVEVEKTVLFSHASPISIRGESTDSRECRPAAVTQERDLGLGDINFSKS